MAKKVVIIVAVIVFVIGVIFACIAWNRYTMKRFIHPKTRNLIYDVYSGTKEKLKVVGEKTDRNGDYKVSEAIKNIKMPENIRLQAKN